MQKLVRWMNTLPIEELATLDFLHEARGPRLVVKAMKYLVALAARDDDILAADYDERKSSAGNAAAIVRRFQRFIAENVEEMKTEVLPANFLEGGADTWIFLRRLHETITARNSKLGDEVVRHRIRSVSPPPPPPPPPPPISPRPDGRAQSRPDPRQEREETTTTRKSLERVSAIEVACRSPARETRYDRNLPPSASPSVLAERKTRVTNEISSIIQLSPNETIDNGLALCRLISHLDLIFNPSIHTTSSSSCSTSVRYGALSGVETAPRTRASRARNVEIALRVVREGWKGVNPARLWSTNQVVDGNWTVALDLCEDLLRYYYRRRRKAMGNVPHSTSSSSQLRNTMELGTTRAISDEEEEEWEGGVDASPQRGGIPPPPPPPSPPPPPPPPMLLEELDSNKNHLPLTMRLPRPPPALRLRARIPSHLEEVLQTHPRVLNEKEKREAKIWLREALGMEVLSPSGGISPVEAASSAEFEGYEGGPFLWDPTRNGLILARCALRVLEFNLWRGERNEECEMTTLASRLRTSLHERNKPTLASSTGRIRDALELLWQCARSLETMREFLERAGAGGDAETATRDGRTTWAVVFALSLVFEATKRRDEEARRMREAELRAVRGLRRLVETGALTTGSDDSWRREEDMRMYEWEEMYERVMREGELIDELGAIMGRAGGRGAYPKTRRAKLARVEANLKTLGTIVLREMREESSDLFVGDVSQVARRILDGDYALAVGGVLGCLDYDELLRRWRASRPVTSIVMVRANSHSFNDSSRLMRPERRCLMLEEVESDEENDKENEALVPYPPCERSRLNCDYADEDGEQGRKRTTGRSLLY